MRLTWTNLLCLTVPTLFLTVANSLRIQKVPHNSLCVPGYDKRFLSIFLFSRKPLYSSNLLHESYDLSLQLFGTASVCGFLSSNIKRKSITEKVSTIEPQSQQIFKFIGGLLTALFLFLSGYVALKTSSVRFQFNDNSLSIVQKDGSNIIDPVAGRGGGQYSWKYKDIVNYCFLPNDNTPIVFYFKETFTPLETRVSAPFLLDTLPGQVHIFPIISDINALKQELQSSNHDLVKVSSTSNFRFETNINTLINGLKIL